MMIREAMGVFWQTLKDTWEELYSLAIVNLAWLFASLIPLSLAYLLVGNAGLVWLSIPFLLAAIVLFPMTVAGMYVVTNRVAHGKTFHFSDFIAGIKTYWWRSLLWFLGNVVFLLLIYANLVFYPSQFEGPWVVLIGGFWLAVLAFWLTMQTYYWPLLIEQENPRMLLAWRNAAYMVLANPFYAFFVVSFSLVLFGLSVALTLPLVFIGMALLGLLGNNAVLILLEKFGIIEEARPKA